jgi:alkylation response protein AidB-like acyl-CoA dehydrogenase
VELAGFRSGVDAWLDARDAELSPRYDQPGTLEERICHVKEVRRHAFDRGWMRYGWPERVGGFGGSSLLRAYLGEALTRRDLVDPGIWSMVEILAPTMIDYASVSLATTMVHRLLRGEETWCQGFSEPGTGSNLASLTCRATRRDAGWCVTGQKVWTGLAQFSERCILLTRTGSADSGHRGITALFVDMDCLGVTARAIETMHGSPEFCEVFFDDVLVPYDRTLGEEGHGWEIAMDILPQERSTSTWHRGAMLLGRLQALLEEAAGARLDPLSVGEVAQALYAFRSRSRSTQYRLAAGERLGPETSIDKVLLTTAEQAVFDLIEGSLTSYIVVDDGPKGDRWRQEYLFSRAASIYGGSAEIQRNIIARRVLGLGKDER